MNILVTGAAGFIGFHLSLSLKTQKNKVLGLDNFNDYYDPENLLHLKDTGLIYDPKRF